LPTKFCTSTSLSSLVLLWGKVFITYQTLIVWIKVHTENYYPRMKINNIDNICSFT
jgi:LEA14-like dessication related protein